MPGNTQPLTPSYSIAVAATSTPAVIPLPTAAGDTVLIVNNAAVLALVVVNGVTVPVLAASKLAVFVGPYGGSLTVSLLSGTGTVYLVLGTGTGT